MNGRAAFTWAERATEGLGRRRGADQATGAAVPSATVLSSRLARVMAAAFHSASKLAGVEPDQEVAGRGRTLREAA
jgi:hypothetical protein